MSCPSNPPVTDITTASTFIVRFWRETTAGQVRWRGRIEHIQSGENAAFLDMDAMLRFLQHYGIQGTESLQRTRRGGKGSARPKHTSC